MKNFFTKLKKKLAFIFRILLFVLTIVILTWFFPKEGKFRYEFQLGQPWKHENLIAPYNFPIYKLDEEFKAERDSILREFKPYFKYDESVVKTQKALFVSSFDTIWNQYYGDENLGENAKELCSDHALEVFEFIYSKGVIEFTDIFDERPLDEVTVVVVKDQIAEERAYDEIFTLKRAYEYLMRELQEYCGKLYAKYYTGEKKPEKLPTAFIRSLNLNEFIAPNLFYDEVTTEKVKKNMLDNLSLTRGMVQAGEGIILKGEIVDREAYRILESLKREYETSVGASSNFHLIFFGQLMLVFVSILVLFLFFFYYNRKIIESTQKTSFVLLLVVLMVLVADFVIESSVVSLFLVPFAVLPIILKAFFDARVALITHTIVVLIIGFLAPNGFEFAFMQFIAGVVGVYSLTALHRRGQLFTSAGFIVLSYAFVYFAMAIIQEGDLSKINFKNFAWFVGNGLLLLSAYPLIYIFEKIFGFLSDLTLLELSDLNNPLLQKLAEQAPGTFQHSIQVSNLAEEVIRQIGGNALLARVGAIYHDIGKKEIPIYFIENQAQGVNPHDKLEYQESARIIISHVTKGIEIAQKNRLPEAIINFIRTHHGTTRVEYFYRMYKNDHPGEEIDLSKFTYPGPKPFSKETAAVMMADSIEAATRSIKSITEEKINELVENIINYQLERDQFDNVDLTFKQITISKGIFKQKMKNIYHSRIEYPDEK